MKRAQSKREAGFTLIEVIVIVAILAILAGILTPMIFKQIDDAKEARALADVKAISTAIHVFRKDTGQWPNKKGGGPVCATPAPFMRAAAGNDPANMIASGYVSGDVLDIDEVLAADAGGCWTYNATTKVGWKGPYLKKLSADPWGNAYIINAEHFTIAGTSVLALSAGPNGEVESGAGAMSPGGDDIAVLIK